MTHDPILSEAAASAAVPIAGNIPDTSRIADAVIAGAAWREVLMDMKRHSFSMQDVVSFLDGRQFKAT